MAVGPSDKHPVSEMIPNLSFVYADHFVPISAIFTHGGSSVTVDWLQLQLNHMNHRLSNCAKEILRYLPVDPCLSLNQ